MFRITKKDEIFFDIFRKKNKEFDRDTFTGVYRIYCDVCSHCYIVEAKRELTLRLKEHQANCCNQKQHSAVVEHSAINHSWGLDRAKIVNAQLNTIKRKTAERLFITNHSTIDGNKSSFPLSIFKFYNHCKS